MRALEMLAHKAWRESRTRFVLGALVLAAVCVVFVVFHAEFRRLMGATRPPASTYGGYLYLRIYESIGRAMFWLIAIVLGLGGLWRERAHGTIGFTLALPVHRWHHAVARAAVGVLQVIALALVPALLVPVCSRLVGASYPWSQALGFAVIWAAAGCVVFAFAFVTSVMIRSDYVALAVAVLGMRIGSGALPRLPGLAGADLHRIMTGRGMAYFDAEHAQLIATPWLTAAATALVAIAMLALAVRITARQRFHEP